MLVYFQIDPLSSLDLGGEQNTLGPARSLGEGLGVGRWVALASSMSPPRPWLKFVTIGSLWGC